MLLEKGKAYFEIVFCLPEDVVPEIESYIFIGKNIFNDYKDGDEYYFQTPCSYYKHGNFAEEKDKMDADAWCASAKPHIDYLLMNQPPTPERTHGDARAILRAAILQIV